MKISDLRPCAVCKGKLPPMWYVIRFSMAFLDRASASQVLGLSEMFGGHLALAEVFAPSPETVVVGMDRDPNLMTEVFICQACFLDKHINLAILSEAARPSLQQGATPQANTKRIRNEERQ